jgi:thioredoxin reductase (NADPH)
MKSRPEIEAAVVGAGPIGIETAIALQEAGIDTALFEAQQIGHAISNWPPDTRFYSPPERIALAGVPVHTSDQLCITGEEYLPYLRMLVEQFELRLHNYEPVLNIERVEGGFLLHTRPRSGDRVYLCRFIVVATGGTAGPRKLGIPGEELPHVQHRFPGPHPYFQTRLLIVGGRNSAVESALRCWRAGAQVTISYRQSTFVPDLIKCHLLDDILARIERGEITFLPSTIPIEITPTYAVLTQTGDGAPNGSSIKHETDFVLLMLGFAADASLLAGVGVTILGEEQMPFHDPKTMETNVPGIFVAGTAVGGTQWRLKHAIYTSHNHVAKIVKAITGQVPRRLGTVEPRNSDISWEEIRANL